MPKRVFFTIFRSRRIIALILAMGFGLLPASAGAGQTSNIPATASIRPQVSVSMTVPPAIRIVAPQWILIKDGYGFADVNVRSNGRWSLSLTVIPSPGRRPVYWRVDGSDWKPITGPGELVVKDRPRSAGGSVRIELRTENPESEDLRVEIRGSL